MFYVSMIFRISELKMFTFAQLLAQILDGRGESFAGFVEERQ